MLYKINDNYYIRIGRKYIEVRFVVRDENVSIIPNNKKFIEATSDLKVEGQAFDDKFKHQIIESRKPRPTEQYKDKKVNRSRFGR